MILKTDNITMQFGGVTAVNLLNIEINEHEIVALIGPNGAGKTTAFNMITGVYTPTSGDVVYTDAKGEQRPLPANAPARSLKWVWHVPSRISDCSKTYPCTKTL